MFYQLFYDFFADIVGTTAMATEHGVLFATYGSYVFCIIAIIMMFGIAKKVLNWFYSAWY